MYKMTVTKKCEECGKEVILNGFTCTCECGVDYNAFGERLAPREQWGWETGETFADIYNGGDDW